MEEEEILDHETNQLATRPIWPYILLGGTAAGAVKLTFALMAPQTSLMLQVILLVLVSMLVMNSTLNFYYQKKNAARDLRSAVWICAGVYVLMQVIARIALYLLDKYPNEFLDFWITDIAVSLGAGMVISVLVAILSKKED